jgi:Zn-dependent M28 family amino/carboxypeptidase
MRLKFLFLLPVIAFAQQPDTIAARFSKFVTADGMKKNLLVLASDEYEGRETGQKGQKMSAEYIKKYYQDLGFKPYISPQLKDGFMQSFPLAVFNPQEVKITVGKKTFTSNTDYFSWANTIGDTTFAIDKIEFCGYGINTIVYNDFDKQNVKDKAVMIIDGEPYKADGKSMISQSTEPSVWASNFRTKQAEAKKQGIKYLFIVDKNITASYAKFEHRITSTRMSIDAKSEPNYPLIIYVSVEMANEIIEGTKNNITEITEKTIKNGKPVHFDIKNSVTLGISQKKFGINAENVMAYIEGSDLKDEVIVLSAHYDHLGIHDGKVYNGADDDGSGTVAIMQLAKAFAEAKKQGKGPRRSMLFLNVSGEEKGLLGSEYYSEHPVFPLDKTVCDLNIDMIGRLDEDHKTNSNYIYLIGADKLSKDLHNVSEQANKTYTKIELDYRYNDENDPNRYYYRSDHYNFAKNGVPVIFYFNGVHADYHQETDEVSKIDFAKMEKITRLVFFTAWEIANRTERLKIDVKK